MRVRGDWPNPVSIRRGWARAHARPWNRTRSDAHIRLVRGSSPFLTAASDLVLGLGASAVISPPLLAGSQEPFRAAGYEPYTTLRLLRKPIGPREDHPGAVRELGNRAWTRVVEIDRAAFGPTWAADLPALSEARSSATASVLLGIDDPEAGEPVGYAIVAAASGSAYLQRLAVDAAHQRRGLGRALTRAAHNWARRRGARMILLNTKPDNTAALALYRSEGYVVLPDELGLLRYEGRREADGGEPESRDRPAR